MERDQKLAIAERLEQIRKLNAGRLTPEAVVEDARDEESPLHASFEWDDAKAAADHRLNQARTLIRSVKVEYNTESRVVSAPFYVHDPEAGDEQGYVPVAKLRNEADLASEVMRSEMARVEAGVMRASGIAGVLGLEAELAEMLERVQVVRRKVAKAG